jgi:hypothetical protein
MDQIWALRSRLDRGQSLFGRFDSVYFISSRPEHQAGELRVPGIALYHENLNGPFRIVLKLL